MTNKKKKNKERLLNSLDERITHDEEFLRRYRDAAEVVPLVQRDLERHRWARQVLSDRNRPDVADEILPPYFLDELEQANEDWKIALPQVPGYSLRRLQTSASLASGTAATYENLVDLRRYSDPGVVSYVDTYTANFQNLQEAHDRPQEIRDLIVKLNNSETVDRFDKAYDDYISVKAGTGRSGVAASTIRNLLSGILSNLKQKALEISGRKQVKHRPKEIFELVSAHLIKVELGAVGEQLLIGQAGASNRLYDSLSKTTKEKGDKSLENLEDIWTQTLEHIATVLGVVDLEKF